MLRLKCADILGAMNVISYVTMLQEYPIIGLLIALGVFAVLFSIKNIIIWYFSKQVEEKKQQDNEEQKH
ncbi:MAG: hypothetical protein K9M17_02695 [Mariprofundaceae bacterium]|nr:hypothetical protein [Mariprofundaceae bacterium]